MKIGIIISQTDPETVWNAFRLGNFSLGKKHGVKVFLVGKGVECEKIRSKNFDVRSQMQEFAASGGRIFSCGTCLKYRSMKGSNICPVSTMQDLMKIVEDSERIVSF